MYIDITIIIIIRVWLNLNTTPRTMNIIIRYVPRPGRDKRMAIHCTYYIKHSLVVDRILSVYRSQWLVRAVLHTYSL